MQQLQGLQSLHSGGSQPTSTTNSQSLSELKLEDIDFEWVQKERNIKKLQKAIQLIEIDGNVFLDLQKKCEDQITEIDPQALKKFDNDVDVETKQQILDDMFEWEQEIEQKELTQKVKQVQEIFEEKPQDKGADTNKIQGEMTKQKLTELAEKEQLKGNQAIKSKDFKEALQYYTKSLKYDPRLTASYYNRALVYLKLNQYDKAVIDCSTAITIQPNYSQAWNRRGRAYYYQQKYQQARSDYLKALQYDPTNSDANGDLKEVEEILKKKGIQVSSGGGFQKVNIIQEEDQDEEQDEKRDDKDNDNKNSSSNPKQKEEEEQEEIRERRRKQYEERKQDIDKIKKKANDKIKDGLYTEAIQLLEQCLEKEQNLGPFSQESTETKQYRQRKANYFNNLALIYKQLDENEKTIAYSNKVLEFEDDLQKDPIIQAVLRRGMAYEQLEKFLQAKNDYDQVKELDPSNMQASKGLNRILPQIDPETLAKANLEVAEMRKRKEEVEEIEKQKKIQEEKERDQIQQEKENRDPKNQGKGSVRESEEIWTLKDLEGLQDQGNTLFKQGKIQDSIEVFTSTIKKLQKSLPSQLKINSQPSSVLYLQLLTNCALALLQVNQNKEALDQCSKTLEIDHRHPKALYRRALARKGLAENIQDLSGYYSVLEQKDHVEKAIEDLKALKSIDQNSSAADDQLKTLISLKTTLFLEIKDREAKQHIGQKAKSPAQEEQKQQAPPKQPLQNNFTGIDEQNLEKAASEATLTIIENLISSGELPLNSSVLEKNLINFKKHIIRIFDYLQQLPVDCINELYKNKEMPHDKLLMILDSIEVNGAQSDPEFSRKLIVNLPQCSQFQMTAMCLSKKEQLKVKVLIEKLFDDETTRLDVLQKYSIST